MPSWIVPALSVDSAAVEAVLAWGASRGGSARESDAEAFGVAGLVALGVGGVGALGGWGRRGAAVGYAASVSSDSRSSRARLGAREMASGFRGFHHALLAGAALLLLAAGLDPRF